MRGNRRRDTKPELRLRSALHRAGCRFRVDYRIQGAGKAVRVDIVFPRVRLAVFVDGCFWHRCPEHGVDPQHNSPYWREKLDGNVDRDRRVNEALAATGWRVVRLWEHTPVENAVTLVMRALADAGAHRTT